MRDVPFRRSLPARLLLRRTSMREDWDERARQNARFFICTNASETEEAFSESGRLDLEALILRGIDLPPGALAVEIGAGIGRLARELAPRVAKLYACDISEEMIRRGRDYCAGAPNVEFVRIDGDLKGVPSGRADLVYSHIVFQHVARKSDIRRYVREAFRVLKPGGIFRANVDGRSRQWFRRFLADSWSGVIFSEREWAGELSRAGFRDVVTSGGGSQYLWGTGRKPN